jgi:hypothetical protein
MNTQQQEKNAPGQNKEVTLIVNGRPRQFTGKEISFQQMVELAFPQGPFHELMVYTVTFKKGPDAKREGSMVAGDTVHVKDGMIFNVTQTDRS